MKKTKISINWPINIEQLKMLRLLYLKHKSIKNIQQIVHTSIPKLPINNTIQLGIQQNQRKITPLIKKDQHMKHLPQLISQMIRL